MQKQSFKYQLLKEILTALEQEKQIFGIDTHLRLQQLLDKLPDDVPESQLCYLFAPLLTKNEQEQNDFYVLFKDCVKRVKAVNESATANVAPPVEPDSPEQKWLLPLLMLLLSGMAIAAYFLNPEKVESSDIKENILNYVSIEVGTVKQFCPVIPDSLNFGDVVQTQFAENTIPDSLSSKFDFDQRACLTYRTTENLGRDSLVFRISNTKSEKALLHYIISIEEKLVVDTTKIIAPEVANTLLPKKNSLPYYTDILQLDKVKLSEAEIFYRKYAHWVKALLLLLTGILLGYITHKRKQKRQKLFAKTESRNQPPYVWNIRLDTPPQIKSGGNFNLVLKQLRQRTHDDHTRLHINRTVQATIRNVGMTVFRYQQQTRPPEYLLLIDRQSPNSHHTALFDYLYHTFRKNEIFIERFFFNADVRLCWNETHPQGISLQAIQHQYPSSRLLLIGNGYQLLSLMSGQLAPWTKIFEQWRQRAILSPYPTQSWGQKEKTLESRFHIAPASLQSLTFLLTHFDSGENADFVTRLEKLKDAPEEPIKFQGSLKKTLTIYFREPFIKWIAACAIYPSLHWDLTLYLGEQLSTPEEPLLTLHNLTQLNRLSWFSEGKIPVEARAFLLEYLEEEEDAPLVLKLRKAIHHILQHKAPPKNSVAYGNYQMNVYFNEWYFTKDKEKKKNLETEMAQLLDTGMEADFVIPKYLEHDRTVSDFRMSDVWKKYIPKYKGSFRALDRQDKIEDYFALFVFILLSLFLALHNLKKPCKEEKEIWVETLKRKIDICINSPEEELIYLEHIARQKIDSRQQDKLDSIHQIAFVLEATDFAHMKYRENLAAALYIKGHPHYILAENLGVASPEYVLQKDSACFYVYETDSLQTKSRDITYFQSWCNIISQPLSTLKIKQPEMVFIQGGTFKMGSNKKGTYSDEQPIHQVTVDDFYMGKFEVTVAEFEQFINATNYQTDADKDGGSYILPGIRSEKKSSVNWKYDVQGNLRSLKEFNHPVIHVSWNDAVAYCNWLSEQYQLEKVYTINGDDIIANWSANGYRLPTEAEWEYAARNGGKDETWAGTSSEAELHTFANYRERSEQDGYEYTAPVGSFKANGAKLHDMSGNVWEWCWDWYDDYSGVDSLNPRGANTGISRVQRGGSWNFYPAYLYCTNRYFHSPDIRRNYIGFRLSKACR